MLTAITPREAPAKGPTTTLDHAICEALSSGGEYEPREIADAVSATLPQIYARLRVLVERGVIARKTEPGAPRRGPGAGRYCKV